MIRLHNIMDRFQARYPRLIALGIISLSVAGLLTLPTNSQAACYSQELEKLNHFVQTSGGSDPEARIFREGRDLISDESWNDAADKFREYVKKYPKGKDTDAALYWLAFSLKNKTTTLRPGVFQGNIEQLHQQFIQFDFSGNHPRSLDNGH